MANPYLRFFALLRRLLLPAALLLGVVQAHAGLVLHYTFDETSGTTAADSSGNGNTGTLTNMTGSEWTTGKVGGALGFGGTNDYVRVADHSSLNPTNNITFSAWINQPSFPHSWNEILMKYEGSFAGGYEIYVRGNGRPRVGMALNGVKTSLDATTAIQTQKWYHLAGTYDGAEMKLYIDGVLDNSRSATGNISVSSQDLMFGGRPADPNNAFIDEIRIYDHALSAGEISALAAGGAGAPEPAETFAFLGLLTAAGLGFREWRSRRKAKAA